MKKIEMEKKVFIECNSVHEEGGFDYDTRHYSVWMDRFAFVSELAKWQVENRELSREEINGAILSWNLTHIPEEAIGSAISLMAGSMKTYRKLLLNKERK